MFKTGNSNNSIIMPITLFALVWASPARAGELLSSRFSYQGRLNLSGSPVSNTADFVFTLWDADVDGTMIGASSAIDDVTIVDGLFAVELDFGVEAFNGESRWLQIDVRSPAGSGAFTTLTPRQPLTATPYSLQTRGLFVNDLSRVGIGTTNPERILHTFGDGIMIESDNMVPGVTLKNTLGGGDLNSTFGLSSDGYAYVSDEDNNPVLYLSNHKTGIGGEAANDFSVFGSIDISESLGVGTTAQADELHVTASGGNANILLSKDDNTYANNVIYSGSGTQYNFGTPTGDRLRVWNDEADEVLTILPNGNVGILNSNPSTKLDVSGDAIATTLFGDGTAITNATAEKIEATSGQVRIGRGVEWYTRSMLLDQENVTVNNYSALTDLWQCFTAGLNRELGAVGVLRGVALVGTPGSAAAVLIYQGEGTSGALLGTTTIPASPVLGWQTASFATPISVAAGQKYTIRLVVVTQLRWAFFNSETYDLGMSCANPNWDHGFRTYLLDFTRDLAPTLVADSTGNVGIGTTTPTATLYVNGTMSATNFVGDGSQLTGVSGAWNENGNDYFYNGGNVVIGSALPMDAKLGINGEMRINDNDILLRDGTDSNHGVGWYGTSKQFGGESPGGPVLYGHKIGQLGTTFGGQNAVLTWKESGDVGIGTTDPASKLDVRGDIRLQPVAAFQTA